MNPLVSVLTPSYNQGQYIGDCIASVANQTYPTIEHVVCDGGSIDSTLDVLRRAPSHVKWSSEPDRGQSHALNKALATSNGEIIGWLNSDDAYADRRAVEAAVRAFKEDPHLGVVYGHGLLLGEGNRVLQFIWAPPYLDCLMNRMTPFVQPSVFFRRDVLPRPFVREDLHYVMDYDLWRRLRSVTKFGRLHAIVGLDRHQPGRKTQTLGYPVERDAYVKAESVHRSSQPVMKMLKVMLRWCGIWPAARLDLQPAIELQTDSIRARVIRQALVPRARMQAEGDPDSGGRR